jgi:hypothetical protein
VRISIREIKDYIRCPLFYKLKNLDEIPIDKTINSYFKDYFRLALFFFYFSLLEKKKKSFELMMKRWEELWFSKEMMEMFPEEELKKKSNEAAMLMNAFFKRFSNEPITPIAVNFQYEAIFEGKEHLHVTGDIDLIKIVNDRTNRSETCIVAFSMSKSYPDIFMVKNDLGMSVASYAFRSNFKAKEDKMILQNICCAEDTPTLRTSNDYLRAEKSIRNICNGIKNGVFYPSPNAISCGDCSYKLFCLNEKSINTGGDKC